MALPPNVITITVTGTYVGMNGVASSGTVSFTPNTNPFTDVAAPSFIVGTTLTATLDSNGHFSIVLPTTDNGHMSPQNWVYSVQESLTSDSRTWLVQIPSSLGATVDLATLPPVVPADTPATMSTIYGVLNQPNLWTGENEFIGAATELAVQDTGTAVTPASFVAFAANHAAAGKRFLGVQGQGDTGNRFTIDYDGRLQWGASPGTSLDTALTRSGAGQLAINGSPIITGSTQAVDWLNVLDYGAVGDGVTDDAAAIQSALNAAVFGQTVYLPASKSGAQTTFALGSTITVPPYVTLRGPEPKRSGSSAGGHLTMLSGFTGTTMVAMVDQATGGYSVPNENVCLIDLTIDGTGGPANVNGVTATGYVHGVQLINVNSGNMSGNGRAFTSVGNGSGNPYSWYFLNCQAGGTGSHGFRFSNLTDSLWINCRAIGCGGTGFYFGTNYNSIAMGCRAEFCSTGWLITENWGTSGNGGGMWFVGCSTDRNTNNGWLVNATGNSPLQFSGIECRRDGRNGNSGGGGFAGFYVNGATTPIVITNLTTSPGVDDNGSGTASPDYGFRAGAATYVSVANSYVWGVVAGWHDDGTNTTLRRGPSIGESTGTIAAPVPNLNNPWGWDSSLATGSVGTDKTALQLTTSVTNINNPLLNITSGGSTGLFLKTGATGDASTRFQQDVSGKMQWGGGAGAKDTDLYRLGAGIVGTDNSFIAVTKGAIGRNTLGSATFQVDNDGSTYNVYVKSSGAGTNAGFTVEAFDTGKRAYDYKITGDSASRLRIDASQGGGAGTIVFGNGTAVDTWLYRSGALALTTNGTINALGGTLVPSDWFNVKVYGATGNGSTDDTAAIQAALNAANTQGGGTVYLPYGQYLISAPLSIPPYTWLVGETTITLNFFTSTTTQARIIIAPGFTPDANGGGALGFYSQTPGGWSIKAAHNGAKNIFIDGSQCSNTSVQGVAFKGPVYDTHLEDVFIWKSPHDGITASGFTESGIGPTFAYHQRWTRTTVANAGFIGFACTNMTDSQFTDCMAFACAGDGWQFNNTPDTILTGCRAQWNGGNGFTVSTSSSHLEFVGCETDNNTGRAWYFNGVTSTGGGIVVSGAMSEADGRGGTHAAIEVNNCTTTITIVGMTQGMDNVSGTSLPITGFQAQGSTNVTVVGSYFEGSTQGWLDNGGNTNLVREGVVAGTGNVGALTYSIADTNPGTLTVPTVYGSSAASGNLQLTSTSNATKGFIYFGTGAAYDGANTRIGIGTQAPSTTLNLSVGATSATAAFLSVTSGTANSNRFLGTRGSGDTVDHFTIDFDGKIQWGPGGSTLVDTNLSRSGVGVLQTTSNLSVSGNQINITRSTDSNAINATYSALNSTNAALAYVASGATGRALGFSVTGDTNGRYALFVDGSMDWGSGSATRDIKLQRAGVGILSLTPENAATTAKLLVNGTVLVGSATVLGDNGVGVLDIANGTAPTVAPTGGVSVYSTAGNLFWQNPAGSVFDLSQAGTTPNTWLPSDSGYLAWTFDDAQFNGTTGSAPSNSNVYLMKIPVRTAISVTNVDVYVTAVGTSLTTNECFIGLYTSAGVLIGQTADLSTDMLSNGSKIHSLPLASGPFAVSAGFVWAAVLMNGTGSNPTLARSNTAVNPAYLNQHLTAATYRVGNLSGSATVLPASFTPSSNQQATVQAFWVGLS